jgi:MFS family permease
MEPASPSTVTTEPEASRLASTAFLIALGWLGTNLGLAIGELPLKFLLKDQLHQTAAGVAAFFAIGQFSNYIKPVAGILTDSIPLFRTRRRWYLLLSLLGTGVGWLLLSLVPRDYPVLLVTYTLLYITVVFTSTTLGGVMVETGRRFRAEGRLTAQRIAMFRLGTLAGGPIAGWLATYPFLWAAWAAAALHLALVPLYAFRLPEAPVARVNRRVWEDAKANLRRLAQGRVLLAAALMIFLIAASPGFGTPLLFHQTDRLHFGKPFIGSLVLVSSVTGLLAAMVYHAVCRTWNLRALLAGSIVIHALGTLTYLGYHSPASAVLVTGLSGVTGTLAVLPVYDLAVRGTPRGCEALGYSVMMSVWNLTNALSDWSGSWLYSHLHLTFLHLVWLNAGTTALVLLAVPFLPAALVLRRDSQQIAPDASPG